MMARRDLAVLLRELAMIEPHGEDASAGIDRRVLPAAIARRVGAGNDRGLRKRAAAVNRS